MSIEEMHVLFRTIGQMNGMQTIRAILPAAIDVYLNIAIVEKVKQIVAQNVGMQFKDKVTIQNNGVGVINSLRTLVREDRCSLEKDENNGTAIMSLPEENIMFITGFTASFNGYPKRYPVRLVDNDKLEETLTDYCSRAFNDSTIVTLINDNGLKAHLYCEQKMQGKVLYIKYIAKPAKVKYVKSNPTESVNCDLPEHLHEEIVELAVQKYFQSVGSTSQAVQ